MDYFEPIDIEILNRDYNSQHKKQTEKNSESNENLFTPSFT